MKNNCKFPVTLLLIASFLLVLTGCGEHEKGGNDAPLHLSLVLGAHDNAPRPALVLAEDDIHRAVTSCGSVAFVNCDGAPYLVDFVTVRPPEKKVTSAKQESIDEKNTKALLATAGNTAAQAPEVDTLSALHLAARNLSGLTGEKQLLILDSGLSTTGVLSFTSGALEAAPQQVVEYLSKEAAIPDLTGVSVKWAGLGDVVSPQESLSFKARANLEAIWRAILEAANASSVELLTASSGLNAASEDVPYVTPVPVPEASPVTFAKPVVFTEEELYFIPDSARLRDPAGAENTLRPVVQYLQEHPDFSLLLAGTTASAGPQEDCVELSSRRAETVRSLLLDAGIPAAQLPAALGLGWDHPYHVSDLTRDGRLDEETAPLNRSVILIDAASAEAKDLMTQFG